MTPWYADLFRQAWIAAAAPATMGLAGIAWEPWWTWGLQLALAAVFVALAVWARRRWRP